MSQLEVNSWEAAGGQQLGGQLIGGCPPLCPTLATLTLVDILDIGNKIRLYLYLKSLFALFIQFIYLSTFTAVK